MFPTGAPAFHAPPEHAGWRGAGVLGGGRAEVADTSPWAIAPPVEGAEGEEVEQTRILMFNGEPYEVLSSIMSLMAARKARLQAREEREEAAMGSLQSCQDPKARGKLQSGYQSASVFSQMAREIIPEWAKDKEEEEEPDEGEEE